MSWAMWPSKSKFFLCFEGVAFSFWFDGSVRYFAGEGIDWLAKMYYVLEKCLGSETFGRWPGFKSLGLCFGWSSSSLTGDWCENWQGDIQASVGESKTSNPDAGNPKIFARVFVRFWRKFLGGVKRMNDDVVLFPCVEWAFMFIFWTRLFYQ